METLEQEKASLEEEKESLIENLEPGNRESISRLNDIDTRLSEIDLQMSQQQAQEVRTAKQEEQKQAFELPKDYNELFDDPRANDEISALIKQVIDQINQFTNDEIAATEATYTEKIQTLTKQGMDAENQLTEAKRQNDHLQAESQAVNDTCNQLRAELDAEKQAHSDTKLSLSDAESKRDAAVNEAELQKQRADALEQKQAHKVVDKRGFQLNLTSDLPDRPIKTALETTMERLGVQPLPVEGQPSGDTFPEQAATEALPTDTEGTSEVDTKAGVTFPGPGQVDGTQSGTDATDSGDQQPDVSAVTRAEHEALKQRVDALEQQANKIVA